MAEGAVGLGSVATGPAGVTAGSPNASLGTLFCTSDKAPEGTGQRHRVNVRNATERTTVSITEQREARETDLPE